MFNEINTAIQEHAIIEFNYGGRGVRRVEPSQLHILGDGKRMLHAYQIGGHSESGHVEGWKTFDLDRMSQFRRTGEKFKGRRPTPTLAEAENIIRANLENGVPPTEIVERLERLGTSRRWAEQRVADLKSEEEAV
jgi:predicted DNA-binding transcriptional regulator YafY